MLHTSDPAFAAQLAAEIGSLNRDRLHRTESVLAALATPERIGVAEVLLDLADRPPLNGKGWERARALLQAVAFDINDHTLDPDEPQIEAPHPRLVALFAEHDLTAL